jgi:hypothetical protein
MEILFHANQIDLLFLNNNRQQWRLHGVLVVGRHP